MRSLHLVCILSFFLFSQCEKENPEPTLPPETTVGANTFGAIVNGEIWSFDLKDSDFSGGASLPLNELLTVSAGFDTDSRDEGIGFVLLMNVIEGEVYYLNDKSGNGGFQYTNLKSLCLYSNFINENTMFNGSLEITHLDKVRKIVSGRFEFEIFIDGEPREGNASCGVITVESGRFDLKYIN
ncbi:MAG: hypothetical protein ACI97P_003055 [Arcticibacterium sp.]|jgi:hypothetical protein